MAHEIETHRTADGRILAAAAFAREDAWHRLGTTIPADAMTAAEALTAGHLAGWNVRTVPLSAVDMTTEGVTSLAVPAARATVRTSPWTGEPEALAVVGAGYTPIQNEETAAILEALIDQSGAVFDTAGSLREGRQCFVSLRLPETITVGGVDPVRTNIVALNSHDGSSAFTILVTPVRVVCANTQAAALKHHSARYSVRHTVGARLAIAAAREALGMTFAYVAEFEDEARKMIDQAMTDAEFAALTGALWPVPERDASERVRANEAARRDCLDWLWSDADTNAAIRGTRWGAYQAVTEWVDHYAPTRDKSDPATTRAHRVLTTSAPEKLKHHAWAILQRPGTLTPATVTA